MKKGGSCRGSGLIPSNGGSPPKLAFGGIAAPWGLVRGGSWGLFLQLGSGSAGTLQPPTSWGLADLAPYLSSISSCCVTLGEPLHLSEPHL